MIRRYNRGGKFDAKVDIYENVKYDATAETFENCTRVIIHGVIFWEMVDGEDALEIERHTDGSCVDDYHEYFVLHRDDGSTATFRNSYADFFAH